MSFWDWREYDIDYNQYHAIQFHVGSTRHAVRFKNQNYSSNKCNPKRNIMRGHSKRLLKNWYKKRQNNGISYVKSLKRMILESRIKYGRTKKKSY